MNANEANQKFTRVCEKSHHQPGRGTGHYAGYPGIRAEGCAGQYVR